MHLFSTASSFIFQDFEEIGIDKRGFRLRLIKAAKKLPILPIQVDVPVCIHYCYFKLTSRASNRYIHVARIFFLVIFGLVFEFKFVIIIYVYNPCLLGECRSMARRAGNDRVYRIVS